LQFHVDILQRHAETTRLKTQSKEINYGFKRLSLDAGRNDGSQVPRFFYNINNPLGSGD
jgi:hypothetical protein